MAKVNELSQSLDLRYEYPVNQTDNDGHGTFCAGMLNGKTHGIDPNVVLIPVKLINDSENGESDIDYITQIFSHIEEMGMHKYYLCKKCTNKNNCGCLLSPCTKKNKCIINMSFIDEDDGENSILNELLDNIVKTDSFILISSAGNQANNSCMYTPGNIDHVINVGSVGRTRDMFNISSFSNWGKCVDFWYIGERIVGISNRENRMSVMSGTSMAAPVAAALASIYLSYNKNASILDIVSHLEQTAKSCAIMHSDHMGEGRNLILSSNPSNIDQIGMYNQIPNCEPIYTIDQLRKKR